MSCASSASKMKHVAQLPIIGFGPQMLIGRCIDQLHSHSHPVAGALDRAFQYSANMQFAGNLRDRLVCPFVMHG